MLIGIDSSPCSLSLRNRSTLSSTTKCHQNKSDLKMFLYKNLFFSISSILSIPIVLIGINGGYFPAICRLCLKNDSESCKALVINLSDLKSHRAERIASSLRLWPEFLLVTVLLFSVNFSLYLILLCRNMH